MIAVDQYWYGRTTHNIFLIERVDGDSVLYSRVGDGNKYLHDKSRALRDLVPLDAEQTARAREVAPAYNKAGALMRVEQLAQRPPPPRGAAVSSTSKLPRAQAEMGELIHPTEYDTFDRLVLPQETIDDVQTAYNMLTHRKELNEVWNLHALAKDMLDRCSMNFYGPPGTGKTATARALAKLIDRPLYHVIYPKICSTFVNESDKNITRAFADCTKHNAILFFDEADALVSSRQSGHVDNPTVAELANRTKIVLMQELDSFSGIVIFCTNMFRNYDEAILRRIVRHVEFKEPDASARNRILRLHLPGNDDRVSLDDTALEMLADSSEGLSGGDLRNAVINAIMAASADDDVSQWILSYELLNAEVEKLVKMKAYHRQ